MSCNLSKRILERERFIASRHSVGEIAARLGRKFKFYVKVTLSIARDVCKHSMVIGASQPDRGGVGIPVVHHRKRFVTEPARKLPHEAANGGVFLRSAALIAQLDLACRRNGSCPTPA